MTLITMTPAKTAKGTTATLPFPSLGEPLKTSGYPIPAEVDPLLVEILSWRREHESKHERQFVEWLIGQIDELGHDSEFMSSEDNLVVTVARSDGLASTTLFSCHTDTCHRNADAKPAKQKVMYDGQRGEIFLFSSDKHPATGDCLGADDGAGVWLMLKMLAANVPGTYVFHRGEERGCIGSSAMAREETTWLKQFDVAVAFDRRGFTEIITHQSGRQRCASDKCASALQAQLHTHGLKNMVLSDRGVVTDTAKYRNIIAECFNIAVGYERNHGPDEYVDYAYLSALCDALIKVEWDALPVDRDVPPAPAAYAPPTFIPPPPKAAAVKAKAPDLVEEYLSMTYDDLHDCMTNFPEDTIRDLDELLMEIVRLRAERDLYKNRGGY